MDYLSTYIWGAVFGALASASAFLVVAGAGVSVANDELSQIQRRPRLVIATKPMCEGCIDFDSINPMKDEGVDPEQ